MEARHVRLIGAAAIAFFAGALFATDYYVDANNGNDDWDGTSNYDNRDESIGKGPKKTLVGAMAIQGLGSGDVVHAAEGVYDEKEVWASNSSNRVQVLGGVGLKADGRVSETIIMGHSSEAASNGIGPDAVRCVRLEGSAWIQGFTIKGGRTPASQDGGGVHSASTAATVDCIITGNGCGNRGTGAESGWYIRCRFYSNNKAGSYGAYLVSGIVGCVFTGGDVCYANGVILNCYMNGGSTWSPNNLSPVYNSFLKQDNGRKAYTNCVFSSAASSIALTSTYDPETCKFSISESGKFDSDYRPLFGTAFVDAGSRALYDKAFPAAWVRFKDKDFALGPRCIGEIDIGAGEYDWRTLPTESGLEFTIEAAEGGETLRVWRNLTSEKLVKGFTYGDTTVMFADVVGGVWETNVTGLAIANSLTPIYEENQTDWYVNPDPTKGDDANPGYHPDCPKRTLVAVMALAKSGDVVHAAKGVYNEGEVAGNTKNRVVIPNGVGLVSDEGPEETVIEGYTPVYYDGDVKKIGGVGSMRCVSMSGTAYIKGFTLRNGATCTTLNGSYGDNGGGTAGGTAIDCIITNCYAVRGGGSASTTLIRCYMAGCGYSTGTNSLGQTGNNSGHGMYGGSAYDSYVGIESLNVVNLVNCTVLGLWVASGNFTHLYNCCVQNSGNELTSSTNTIWRFARTGMVLGEGSSIGQVSIDSQTKRPVAGETKAIDKGNVAYYTYPAGWEHEMGKDFKGGQRIYNGQIDIGCGEFDWRGVYGGKLNANGRAEVAAASANVTTNTLDGVVLYGGDSVEVEYTVASATAHACTFKVVVSGEGSVTARFGDEVLVPDASGTYTFSGATGVNRVTILFEGAGSAVVSSFAGPHVGVQFVIR